MAARKKKNLVIVESPAKAKTINKYLGGNFKVLASYGHVRDLPKRRRKGEVVAGIDIESGWVPTYVVTEREEGKPGRRTAKDILAMEVRYLKLTADFNDIGLGKVNSGGTFFWLAYRRIF